MSVGDLIFEKLSAVKVIDTHEHLYDEDWRLENIGDWTTLFHHYGVASLLAAGMSNLETDVFYSPETSHEKKWDIFSKYYPLAKNTAYMKATTIAINDIYGIDHISRDSMQQLSGKMKEMVKPGFNRWVLQELSGIDYCLVNSFDCDANGARLPARLWGETDLYRPEPMVDLFIYPEEYEMMSQETGVDCSCFEGWLKGIDAYFEKHSGKFRSLKVALAYSGHLEFQQDVPYDLARGYFEEHRQKPMSYDQARPLVDFLFYYVLQKAREDSLALKFHTGAYSGVDNQHFDNISGNVRHLAAVALRNSDIKFIAMHIAYPYQDELVMAVKQSTNLYADLSWAWIVDPYATMDFLKKAVGAAPINKITGFGGDYSIVENTYGHLQIARRGIAEALASLVSSRLIGEEEAVEIGHNLLRGSALAIYGE